jgi:hypothetical protein
MKGSISKSTRKSTNIMEEYVTSHSGNRSSPGTPYTASAAGSGGQIYRLDRKDKWKPKSEGLGHVCDSEHAKRTHPRDGGR